MDNMGTTLNVHLHNDETVEVQHFEGHDWPGIVVKGEYGYPITDLTLMFEAAPLGVVALGVLDDDKVQNALTPEQLSQLARIVRAKAPHWILREAGLLRADVEEHRDSDRGDAVGGELHHAGKYVLCPECGHVGAQHDKVGGVTVGCTAPSHDVGGRCTCTQAFDVATSTFCPNIDSTDVVGGA